MHRDKQILGDFEIIGEIGRGGMGIVYEARQRSLNRRVALKVLSSGLGLSEKAISRFRREAEAAARLHHTNIVPIYATGEEHGTHYYAMELIDGPSLDQVIRRIRAVKPATSPAEGDAETDGTPLPAEQLAGWVGETMAFELPPRNSADAHRDASSSGTQSNSSLSSSTTSNSKYFDAVAIMLADVADALHHAHAEGVIHRDIKPSNLLLSADGRLSLNDFGLARVLEQPGMTMSGEFVGSPLYMSPEQISAGRAPLDHRTDIYSLGATLYELLTLEPPFPGQQRDQVIGQILHKEPFPPRRKNRKVPVDLETICLKALEKDPDRRYQTAGQMGGDLRHFVNRFAISARRIGPLGRAVKWVRRNRAVSTLLVLLLLTASLAGGMWYRHRLDRLEQIELNRLARLEQIEQDRLARLEQIEQVKDTLLLHVLSGELDQGREQLEKARRLGAPQVELDLMRAQIDLFDGKYDDVVQTLERHELRGNTAAYAILTNAYMLSVDEIEHLKRLPNLVASPARDYSDYLLKGWAESYWLSDLAVRDLEEAIRQRKSPLAMLLYGEALLYRGYDSADAKAAETDVAKALENIQAARAYLGKAPWPEACFVLAKIVDANLRSESLVDRRERLTAIHPEAESLADWKDTSVHALFVYSCYLQQADMRSQLGSFRRRSSSEDPSGVRRAAELFRVQNDWEATQALDALPTKLRNRVQSMKVFIDMSAATAVPKSIAQVLLQKQAGFRGQEADIYAAWDIWALQLLGERETARKLAGQYRDSMAKADVFKSWKDIGEFFSGDGNPTTLLERCSASKKDSAHAHFSIAIRHLAEDERQQAKMHFQAVLETHCFLLYAYCWSEAFLQRMEDDERRQDIDWLPWLKKEEPR